MHATRICLQALLAAATLLASGSSCFGAQAAAPPDWFRKAEVYNGWYKKWDEAVIAEKMTNLPLVIGAPADRKLVEQAHRQGTRVLTYITLYQAPTNQVYQDLKLGEHPDWVVIKADGRPAASVFGSENPGWCELCANNAGFRKAALAYIRKILDTGIDGLFIDNAHPPRQCYGEKCGKHQHILSGEDHLQPWQDLIREVVKTVKAKNRENIVILNPGEPSGYLRGLADGIMIESYICTYASKTRWHDWNRLLNWARQWGDGPDQIVTLSYIGHTAAPAREDAFYCYACARLSGFLWADWYSGFDQYKDLFALRLGAAQGRLEQQGPVYFRLFEKGLVAVNPGAVAAALTVPVSGWPAMVDQFSGTPVVLEGAQLRVEIPAKAGRVYRAEPK